MSNYLKKILFFLLIFITPYINFASNAMNVEDYDSSTIRARRVSFVKEDQQNVPSFSKSSSTSEVRSLEDPEVFWSFPVKSVFHGAYKIIEFATQKPKIAMFIGLSYMIPVIEAGYKCVFQCSPSGCSVLPSLEYTSYQECMSYTKCSPNLCLLKPDSFCNKFWQSGCDGANCNASWPECL